MSQWLLLLSILTTPIANASDHGLVDGSVSPWEVFAFVGKVGPETWLKFDWDKLTTVVLVGNYNDSALVDHAHRHGVKAVAIANIYKVWLPDPRKRKMWILEQLRLVEQYNLDGINFDFEQPIDEGSREQKGYTKLIQETAKVFKSRRKDYQISVDLAWAPEGIDGRFYDAKAIAETVDLIFSQLIALFNEYPFAQHSLPQLWPMTCNPRCLAKQCALRWPILRPV